MHVGRSYRLRDFVFWSRRSILYMTAVSVLAVVMHLVPMLSAFTVPWSIVLVIGTTASFVAGFKNSQVLQRSGEALQTFSGIVATSRMLANICCDFTQPEVARRIVLRHLAWLTALRYFLRKSRPWETMSRPSNREFRRRYQIQEDSGSLPAELATLMGAEGKAAADASHPALALLAEQGHEINMLLQRGDIPSQIFGELSKLYRECQDHQARCERIKNSPYPRQYAIVSAMFVVIFVTLLPFGIVQIVSELAGSGPLIWLTVPFSVLLGWIYLSLDQVGENTSNPFEGNANDVPISQICRDIEIEMRGKLGDKDLPAPLLPVNGIAM
ncbi:MAG TPA: bestrophin family ion channel [Devosiaceae bacterium]|jgi:putative membrane protein